ncbi:hypothetical protein CEXT_124071 [Caerostris extrusa]|uniref:Uncharacterized protein n=1 Tax=Caerostris extrusa TaxID=172846 RepID=A0AAV4MIM1_CAEEX|nr:hypothetical protein CEXT_124071 [Caerostris extrusa]
MVSMIDQLSPPKVQVWTLKQYYLSNSLSFTLKWTQCHRADLMTPVSSCSIRGRGGGERHSQPSIPSKTERANCFLCEAQRR